MLFIMAFDSIQLITFDCYGTLIDWETGMLAALRPAIDLVSVAPGGRAKNQQPIEEHFVV